MGTRLIACLITCGIAGALAAPSLPVAPGPFQPTIDSLTNYHCPDWFRDAKFGIWAHWGPQAVPMDGDWASFSAAPFGQVEIRQPGSETIKLRARNPATWKPINVRSLRLTRVPE